MSPLRKSILGFLIALLLLAVGAGWLYFGTERRVESAPAWAERVATLQKALDTLPASKGEAIFPYNVPRAEYLPYSLIKQALRIKFGGSEGAMSANSPDGGWEFTLTDLEMSAGHGGAIKLYWQARPKDSAKPVLLESHGWLAFLESDSPNMVRFGISLESLEHHHLYHGDASQLMRPEFLEQWRKRLSDDASLTIPLPKSRAIPQTLTHVQSYQGGQGKAGFATQILTSPPTLNKAIWTNACFLEKGVWMYTVPTQSSPQAEAPDAVPPDRVANVNDGKKEAERLERILAKRVSGTPQSDDQYLQWISSKRLETFLSLQGEDREEKAVITVKAETLEGWHAETAWKHPPLEEGKTYVALEDCAVQLHAGRPEFSWTEKTGLNFTLPLDGSLMASAKVTVAGKVSGTQVSRVGLQGAAQARLSGEVTARLMTVDGHPVILLDYGVDSPYLTASGKAPTPAIDFGWVQLPELDAKLAMPLGADILSPCVLIDSVPIRDMEEEVTRRLTWSYRAERVEPLEQGFLLVARASLEARALSDEDEASTALPDRVKAVLNSEQKRLVGGDNNEKDVLLQVEASSLTFTREKDMAALLRARGWTLGAISVAMSKGGSMVTSREIGAWLRAPSAEFSRSSYGQELKAILLAEEVERRKIAEAEAAEATARLQAAQAAQDQARAAAAASQAAATEQARQSATQRAMNDAAGAAVRTQQIQQQAR